MNRKQRRLEHRLDSKENKVKQFREFIKILRDDDKIKKLTKAQLQHANKVLISRGMRSKLLRRRVEEALNDS